MKKAVQISDPNREKSCARKPDKKRSSEGEGKRKEGGSCTLTKDREPAALVGTDRRPRGSDH